MTELREVLFKDMKLYLLPDDADRPLQSGPLIAHPKDFECGLPSYAHLFENGDIMRYKQLIGNRSDLTLTGQSLSVEPTNDAFLNLGGPGWR